MTVMFCRLREFDNTIQVYMIKHLSIVGKVLVYIGGGNGSKYVHNEKYPHSVPQRDKENRLPVPSS